jgi:hypothetical protein
MTFDVTLVKIQGLREERFVGQNIIGMSENIGLGKKFQMRHKL